MNLQQFRQMLRLAVGAVLFAAVAAPLASAASVKSSCPMRMSLSRATERSVSATRAASGTSSCFWHRSSRRFRQRIE